MHTFTITFRTAAFDGMSNLSPADRVSLIQTMISEGVFDLRQCEAVSIERVKAAD